MKQYPSISFIIPTLNAEKYLFSCLSAIHNQTYPNQKVEILVIDGGSEDKTRSIAIHFGATIINNKTVFQEPGKTLGTNKAKGDLVCYIDSDNIILEKDWLIKMTAPFMNEESVIGAIPLPIPDSHSHSINQYFGYMFTDPFTSFVYGNASNPRFFNKIYKPFKIKKNYTLYKFPENNPPLFGFAQGVMIKRSQGHGKLGYSDDMMSGIEALKGNACIAYIPQATLYHHHIENLQEFLNKYTWRVRNNLIQKYKGVGITIRKDFFSPERKIRMYIFPLYALTIIFPLLTSIKLIYTFKKPLLLIHVPLTLLMGYIIVKEYFYFKLFPSYNIGNYQ